MTMLATVSVEDNPSEVTRLLLQKGLWEFNSSRTENYQYGSYAVVARTDSDNVIGGAICTWVWNWVHIESLFILDSSRQAGIGKRILRLIESRAVELGCTCIHCDTFSFQAVGFYLKHGYTVFGELDGFPSPHKRYYLRKQLEIG